MQKNEFDIIIIGGGLIGCSMAYALRDLPLSIALVEANTTPTLKPPGFDTRAISLSLASKNTFTGMGIWSELLKLALPIHQIHVSEKGKFGATRFCAEDVDVPALGYVVEAALIGHTLHEALQTHSRLTWFHSASLQAFKRNADSATVTLLQHEKTIELKAQLIIGCDGAYSKTRECAAISYHQTDFSQTAIVSTIGLQQNHFGVAYERFTDKGPIAFLPLPEQRAALIWSAPNELKNELLNLSDEAFLARLQQQFGYRLGKFTRMGKRNTYPLIATRAEQLNADRVILIGNAAHALHPIAGQGFNLGLRDVAVLAQQLRDALLNQQSIADPAVLHQYVELREQDQKNITFLCEFLPRVYENNFLPYAWFRSFCMCSLDVLPFWKKYFMQHTLGTHGWQSDLACGLPIAMKTA